MGEILLAVSTKLVAFFSTLTSEKRATALVIDDSLYSKNRSKKVELLSRVLIIQAISIRKATEC